MNEKRRLQLKNAGDWIRLRNLLVYKAFHNTTRVNRYINYEIDDKKAEEYIPVHLLRIEEIDKNLITAKIRYVGKMAMANRFDLLGSGWVCYGDNDPEKGSSIRWNTDIRTGYVWPCGNLDERECIASPTGTDIKNVWELGRMNYLIPLSFYILSTDDEEEKRNGIIHYCNLLKDFILNNPVGKGVNWVLAMEASIRISNIMLSYDIVSQMDDENIISEEFKMLVYKSIYAHIKFIWNNQEKNIFGGRNGNHYYSNMVGLLISAGYLKKRNPYCTRIFHYAKDEFIKESVEQFYEEGGHFEQSTGYFRLTAEMLVFGAAIIKENGYELPGEIRTRIINNYLLAKRLKRSDGTYYSFGDCDSGCFVKTGYYGDFMQSVEAESLFYNYQGYCEVYGDKEAFFVENQSSMENLVRYSEGILNFPVENQKNENLSVSIENVIISMIAGGAMDYGDGGKMEENHAGRIEKNVNLEELKSSYPVKKSNRIPLPCDSGKSMHGFFYNGMGFYIMRSKNFSLLYRFGNDECIGHSHNDSLHYEYEIAGKHFQADPGTYTYTGYPETRNKYRTTEAHNVPQYGIEQRNFDGIFGYRESDYREVLEVTDYSIAVRYWNDRFDHVRRIIFGSGEAAIEDYGKTDFDLGMVVRMEESPGYGVLRRTRI